MENAKVRRQHGHRREMAAKHRRGGSANRRPALSGNGGGLLRRPRARRGGIIGRLGGGKRYQSRIKQSKRLNAARAGAEPAQAEAARRGNSWRNRGDNRK